MKLTREERSALFHGQTPRIVRERKPCEPGTVIALSSRLSIEIQAVRRVKVKQWRVDYLIRDYRPMLMRRVPTTDRPRKNADGKVIEPDQEYARIDSSYTTTSHAAVPDGGDVVDELSLRRFTDDARRRELEAIGGFMASAESVLAAIRERAKVQPSIRRELWPLQRELNRVLERERRKAA